MEKSFRKTLFTHADIILPEFTLDKNETAVLTNILHPATGINYDYRKKLLIFKSIHTISSIFAFVVIMP
jgi:hypothetical protein